MPQQKEAHLQMSIEIQPLYAPQTGTYFIFKKFISGLLMGKLFIEKASRFMITNFRTTH